MALIARMRADAVSGGVRWCKGFDLNNLLFFAGLSVIVGALEASGRLEYISRGIAVLPFDRPWLPCLILTWSAALMAAFLNWGFPVCTLFFFVSFCELIQVLDPKDGGL